MATIFLRWFLSRTVRQALDTCRQARKILSFQRDILPPAAGASICKAIDGVCDAISSGRSAEEIADRTNDLEKAANQHLKPYPNANWRENIEVLLVTGAIVLAFRTFFFQPMAIPSGSAQPTLWGIHEEEVGKTSSATVPNGFMRAIQAAWSGIHYFHLVADEDGELTIEPPRTVFPFVKSQTFRINGRPQTLWFVPDDLANRVRLAGVNLFNGQQVRRGQDIFNIKVVSGDHLFVNCMIYNFRRPRRGEIIVFHTHDIDRHLRIYRGFPGILTEDTHYIKRLVGLSNEHVRIGDDRHVVIDGVRLDASTPHFENVYGFDPKSPPSKDHYSGHVNNLVARRYDLSPLPAALFPDARTDFLVRTNYYLTFGDNTMNSYDGRAWGDFPREKVIGRASFVFWPITERFGWGYR